ncbi:hypothetical protein F3D3_1083 [Fusibacter sp. 3D3]|nr:hypothetical protein F3D3_1083 [Fusibacter sp. 3D3]
MINKIIQKLNMSPLMIIFIYLLTSAWLILNSYILITRGIHIDTILFLIFSFLFTFFIIKLIDLLFKAIKFESKFNDMLDHIRK